MLKTTSSLPLTPTASATGFNKTHGLLVALLVLALALPLYVTSPTHQNLAILILILALFILLLKQWSENRINRLRASAAEE